MQRVHRQVVFAFAFAGTTGAATTSSSSSPGRRQLGVPGSQPHIEQSKCLGSVATHTCAGSTRQLAVARVVMLDDLLRLIHVASDGQDLLVDHPGQRRVL